VNVSWLSGNLAADDSYHVVTASGSDETAVLDGFSITSGLANDVAPNDRGAGIYNVDGSATIRNVRVTSNLAAFGAGVYNEGGHPSFTDVEIDGNEATVTYGGGFHNNAGSPSLSRVTFRQNSASAPTGEGGAFFSQGVGTPRMIGARFYGNTAYRGAGIANWPDSQLVVDNAIFSGNVASDFGGAFFNWLGSVRVNNSTLSQNSATAGGAFYLFDPVRVRNSIVWGNTGGEFAGVAASVEGAIVQGGYAGGTAVLDSDPLFRDPAGPDSIAGTQDDDFRLQAASPARDSGGPEACTGSDIDGRGRVGAACDLGAIEYQGLPGDFWTNGEIDGLHAAESTDATPIAGALRQSANDFVVPADMECTLSAVRAVLQDHTASMDAVAELYSDNAGQPGALLDSFSTAQACAHDANLACDDFYDCMTATTCSHLSTCPGAPGAIRQCAVLPGSAQGYCTYPCEAPGQSLGSRDGGRLWEHEFDGLGNLLSEGRYWFSVYGTQESGSPGAAYWLSADDGAVTSNPYQFRQVGFAWVDGGVFNGGPSRDLSLEVDAICVPEPGSLAMLISGGALLACLNRRERSHKSRRSSQGKRVLR
jgi:hypothetical protein